MGTPSHEEGDVTQPIQWSSEFFDEESGLMYYNHRYYNSIYGVWNERDKVQDRYINNAYLYVQNATSYKYDILGLMTIYEWAKITFSGTNFNWETLVALLLVASRGCIGIVGTQLGVDAKDIDLSKCYKNKGSAENAAEILDCSECTNIYGQKSKARIFSVHAYEGIVYNDSHPEGFERRFEEVNGVYDLSSIRNNTALQGIGYGNYDFAILDNNNQMLGATHADLKLYNVIIKKFKLNIPLIDNATVNNSIKANPQMNIRDIEVWQSEVGDGTGYNTEFGCIMCEKDTIKQK